MVEAERTRDARTRGDPLALRHILRECAPKRPGKSKRAEGQCHGCYSAHVALLLALRRRERSAAKGAKGREDEGAGMEEEGEREGEDGVGDEEEEEEADRDATGRGVAAL